jgi:radical SAM superfamily enzyme YgiQ (UPF0313 family)
MAQSALVALGNEESYGLEFVGGELLQHGHRIKFFDGEEDGIATRIANWKPDYVMFSPLATFFSKAVDLAKRIKSYDSKAWTVFGGHHVTACDETSVYIDTVVKGPVRGAVGKIQERHPRIIRTVPTIPSDMPVPARAEYYRDIPRAAKRYRKFMLSMLGCPWNCTYCSSASGHIRDRFGRKAHKNYFMRHRPLDHVLSELNEIMRYDTHELEWVDDDVFAGDEEWLLRFLPHVPVPMYVSATSHSILKASDRLLREMRKKVNVVGMGIQAIRPSSLKLLGRPWDNEKKMKAAYDRLVSYGYRVNLQAIVGLPIDDSLEDAIETVMGLQRIGKGSICSVYPLMVYPGTKMYEYCKDWPRSRFSTGDTSTGYGDLSLPHQEEIKNLCKLATFAVKYGIDESLLRILIRGDYGDISKDLSLERYRECVIDRLGEKGKEIFNEIAETTRFKY